MKKKLYTLKQASEIPEVHPKTIQKWDREGKIKVTRTPADEEEYQREKIKHILGLKPQEGLIIGYARVFSQAQKDDLERQIEAIKEYARERGWQIQILKGIGSGLKENGKNYRELLSQSPKERSRKSSSLIPTDSPILDSKHSNTAHQGG